MKERTSLITAVVITLLLIGTASAYSVPTELKGNIATDDELYQLATAHATEPWARYLLDDLGYKYNARNRDQLWIRMNYQAGLPKITRNNLVRINN